MRALALLLLTFLAITATARAQDRASIFEAALDESDAPTPQVTTEELIQILADGSATVFDVRPSLEYSISHIPGALNVGPKPGQPISLYTADVADIGSLVNGDHAAPIVLYCNGPFCGKSKRVAADLIAAGYENVRRYQLGMPVWRALGGVAVIEPEGVAHVRANDQTAVFVDAREPAVVAADPYPGARVIPLEEVKAAKDDGRLPMEDHNTRIIVFGADAESARAVAESITANAFHNVSYFDGDLAAIRAAAP